MKTASIALAATSVLLVAAVATLAYRYYFISRCELCGAPTIRTDIGGRNDIGDQCIRCGHYQNHRSKPRAAQ